MAIALIRDDQVHQDFNPYQTWWIIRATMTSAGGYILKEAVTFPEQIGLSIDEMEEAFGQGKTF